MVKKIRRRAVFIGLVGARFEKKGFNEWQTLVKLPANDDATNEIFRKADHRYHKNELKKHFKYAELSLKMKDSIAKFLGADPRDNAALPYGKLDLKSLRKRYEILAHMFLHEASSRGKDADRDVYAATAGLGTGAWMAGIPMEDHIKRGDEKLFVCLEMLTAHVNVFERGCEDLRNIKFVEFNFSCDWVKTFDVYCKQKFGMEKGAIVDQETGHRYFTLNCGVTFLCTDKTWFLW